MLATVQCAMTTPGFVSTGCTLIVSQGADSDVDSKRPKATRYTRYTLASRQRKILPTRGCRMNLCRCDIMPLSFMNDGTGRGVINHARRQGVADAASLDREYRCSAGQRLWPCACCLL